MLGHHHNPMTLTLTLYSRKIYVTLNPKPNSFFKKKSSFTRTNPGVGDIALLIPVLVVVTNAVLVCAAVFEFDDRGPPLTLV